VFNHPGENRIIMLLLYHPEHGAIYLDRTQNLEELQEAGWVVSDAETWLSLKEKEPELLIRKELSAKRGKRGTRKL
jgi:hypothetical protein